MKKQLFTTAIIGLALIIAYSCLDNKSENNAVAEKTDIEYQNLIGD